jgi:sodium-dependent dicarboxylate transporter 2/3/5
MDECPLPLPAGEEKFEQWRQRIGLLAAPLAGIALWLSPLPLPPNAHVLAAVFVFTIILWMTEAIPLAAAGLLGPTLLVICGVGKMEAIFAPFAHPIVFLFIGSFLLASAMQKHLLDRRLALGILGIPGLASTPARMIVTMGALTTFLSMWMSNTAITAVMLPIGVGMLRASPPGWNTRKVQTALVLMIAFAASIGGLATPVGTATNLIALAQLDKAGIVRPGFYDWMKLGVPLSGLLLVTLVFILRPPKHTRDGDGALLRQEVRRQRQSLGRIKTGEVNTAVCFCLAVALWLYPGMVEALLGKGRWGSDFITAHLPEEAIGLLSGVLLFLMPVRLRDGEFTLSWKDAAQIDWGTILLFGGGFTLGFQIKETGLSQVIGNGVISLLGHPGEGTLLAVAIVLSLVCSEATSNTATATVLVPLMIGVAESAGVNVTHIVIGTCLACSLGFMLPISTPPNALAYGTGLVRIPAMMKYGLMLDVTGAIAVWVLVRWIL